jgi:hypothetical protein
MSDPVVHIPGTESPDSLAEGYTSPGWYFYDETWVKLYGPYSTEQKCRDSLCQYFEEVLGGSTEINIWI